jgi:hypothetical protein
MILPILLAWLLSLPASEAFLHVQPPASALTCSSAARFSAYKKEVPSLALFASPTRSSPQASSSSSSTSSSSSSLLPLDPTTPALYTGMSRLWRRDGDDHPARSAPQLYVYMCLCACPWKHPSSTTTCTRSPLIPLPPSLPPPFPPSFFFPIHSSTRAECFPHVLNCAFSPRPHPSFLAPLSKYRPLGNQVKQ